MSLAEKIKALLAKEPTTEPSPNPDPEPAATTPEPAPDPDPTPPADPPEDPKPETFTKAEVQAMLEQQSKETEEALAEIVKSFKGQEAPPIGSPPEPVNTSDFSQWNQELQKIKDNLNK
jgi:DNA-binding transcriptional MerR regulator